MFVPDANSSVSFLRQLEVVYSSFWLCSFSIGREDWLEHAVLHGLDEIIVRGALWMRDIFSRRAGWLGTLGATLISLIGNDVIER